MNNDIHEKILECPPDCINKLSKCYVLEISICKGYIGIVVQVTLNMANYAFYKIRIHLDKV